MQYVPVSVVIPCYKCSAIVGRAVESVLKQTVLPKQLILIDDDSPDNNKTLSTLYNIQEKNEENIEILVVHLDRNKGAASARNAGWNLTTQPYVAFLDADDAWHNKKLEIQYNWMRQHPNVALSAHGCIQLSDNDSFPHLEVRKEIKEKKVNKWKLLLSNTIATRTVMIKNQYPYRFLENKRYSEDYLLWLEISLADADIYLLDVPLAYFFKAAYGEGGLSAQLWQMEEGELETYWYLFKGKRINLFMVALLQLFSLVKYQIRVFKSLVHKIKV